MDLKTDFNTYWDLMQPGEQFANRRDAAEQEWHRHPEKQRAIIVWLRKHGSYSSRNPFFFIQDFQMRHQNSAQRAEPVNLNGTARGGRMLEEGTAFIACYNGQYGLYSLQDIDDFHMQIKMD